MPAAGLTAAGSLAGGIGALGSLGFGIAGAGDSAEEARKMRKFMERVYRETVARLEPWVTAGQGALPELQQRISAGPGEFTESPGYQFRLDQGVRAVDQSAAARGMLQSGGYLKDLTQFGQDYGSNEYQNFLNQYYQSLSPLMALSEYGQSAAAQTGSTGSGIAANIAQLGLNQGAARQDYMNQIGSLAGYLGSNQFQNALSGLDKLFGGRTSSYGTTGFGNNALPNYGYNTMPTPIEPYLTNSYA